MTLWVSLNSTVLHTFIISSLKLRPYTGGWKDRSLRYLPGILQKNQWSLRIMKRRNRDGWSRAMGGTENEFDSILQKVYHKEKLSLKQSLPQRESIICVQTMAFLGFNWYHQSYLLSKPVLFPSVPNIKPLWYWLFKKKKHSICKPGVEGYLIQPAHMDYAPYM